MTPTKAKNLSLRQSTAASAAMTLVWFGVFH